MPRWGYSAVRIVCSGELTMGGQEHFYLETMCAIARADETAASSWILRPSIRPRRRKWSRVCSGPSQSGDRACLRMGGAFGGKEVQANPWAAIAALGTLKTKRPVRVRLPRALDMVLTGKRHPFYARFEAGFADDGKLRAVTLELFSDGGWSLDLSDPVLWRALFHCDNAYLIPALDATG